MNTFNELSDVRLQARARCVEDFAYFAQNVLGKQLSEETCRELQLTALRHGVVPPGLSRYSSDALSAWLCVLRNEELSDVVLTDTLRWLFAELVPAERAA